MPVPLSRSDPPEHHHRCLHVHPGEACHLSVPLPNLIPISSLHSLDLPTFPPNPDPTTVVVAIRPRQRGRRRLSDCSCWSDLTALYLGQTTTTMAVEFGFRGNVGGSEEWRKEMGIRFGGGMRGQQASPGWTWRRRWRCLGRSLRESGTGMGDGTALVQSGGGKEKGRRWRKIDFPLTGSPKGRSFSLTGSPMGGG